jgi:hypothetical protein
MLGKIRDRNPSVIASICDYHRKPLVLNTVLIDLFDTKELVYIAKREAERGGFY